jgi:hypothetical protein
MVPTLTITELQKNTESDRLFRMRRHDQWTTNYELYRDTVIINRLTQRQSVNVPYMKGTLKTYLKKTAAPDLEFEDKNNDGQNELELNAYWQDTFDRLKLKVLDYVDRKQEFLYGRSFMKLNIVNGRIVMEVIDSQDVLVERYVNPWDIESARHLTHIGIYRSIDQIEQNPLYDKDVITRLKAFFGTKAGLILSAENTLALADRAKRMLDLGVPDALLPIIGGTIVELNEHQVKLWDPEEKKLVVVVAVTCMSEILMQKPMKNLLGVNFVTFCSWAGDVERTDWWSDGMADSVRQLNQVANARVSQKVENGTLANFGMNFYNTAVSKEWSPVGYEPAPFGFYGFPGDPNKDMRSVMIPEMRDFYDELGWYEKQIESVSATTSAEKGDEAQSKNQTLGEFQALLKQADERLESSTPFREQYWKDIGEKWVALVDANAADLSEVPLYKKSQSGKLFEKKVQPTKSKKGYVVKVNSKANREADDLKMLQKLNVAKNEFPMNTPLQRIMKKKTIDWLRLTPEETQEVMDFDDQQPAMPTPPVPGGPTPGAPTPAGPMMIPARKPQPAYA